MIRAIFPLPVFILPQGYTRLRVFETRYLDMVKDSFKTDSSFILCHYDQDAYLNVPEHGCLVKIVDFDKDESGQLLIDIVAQSLVKLTNVMQDKNQLRYGEANTVELPQWLYQPQQVSAKDDYLKASLEHVFNQDTDISGLYKKTDFDNLSWVTARWLELLPISHDKKQQLAFSSSFANIQNFLHTVINNELTE